MHQMENKIPKFSSVLSGNYEVKPDNKKESWTEYPKRKWNEFKTWLNDPKTQKALVNAAAIIAQPEYASKKDDERLLEAIQEKDPEVRSKTNNIIAGLVSAPVFTAAATNPVGQAVIAGLGGLGTISSAKDFIEANTDQEKNDALVNAVMNATAITAPFSSKIGKYVPENLNNIKKYINIKLPESKQVLKPGLKRVWYSIAPNKTIPKSDVYEWNNIIDEGRSDAIRFVNNAFVKNRQRQLPRLAKQAGIIDVDPQVGSVNLEFKYVFDKDQLPFQITGIDKTDGRLKS